MHGGLTLNKNLIRIESADGEVHFQECIVETCLNAKQYTPAQAKELAKKEAEKPLLLNQKYQPNQ